MRNLVNYLPLGLCALAGVMLGSVELRAKSYPARGGYIDHLHLAPGQKFLSKLPTWSGGFTDFANHQVNFTMVGKDPASDAVTIVPVYVIPVRMVYGAENGNTVLDPVTHTVSNGLTVVQNVKASPLFDPTTDYKLGDTDVGRTQYVDAFQRANFWATVNQKKNYHVMLGEPLDLPELEISVSKDQGEFGKRFGRYIGTMDQKAFDSKIVSYARKQAALTGDVFAVFVTYNVYLTHPKSNEIIGGYHSAYWALSGVGIVPEVATYAYATYVDKTGAFAQDVSALSHEIAEWMDDPFTQNKSNCSSRSALEVGDPLEYNLNYGTFVKKLNGFPYHLQSLAFLSYFGAPPDGSVNGWTSFQGAIDNLAVCSFESFVPPDSSGVGTTAINASGQIVGRFWDSTDGAHGFLRATNGSIVTFDAPDADPHSTGGTHPRGMNANGTIAGDYTDSGEGTHSFIRNSDGGITEFDPPSSLGSSAVGINNSGNVAGYATYQTDKGNIAQGYLRTSDGTLTAFSVPNAPFTRSSGINDSNAIAGTYYDVGNQQHGFVRSASGDLSIFDIAGAKSIGISGITSNGTVGGYWYDDTTGHGFVRSPEGKITTVDVPGATSVYVTGFSESGTLVGVAENSGLQYWHGFERKADGSITTFDAPPWGGFPRAINEADQIAGDADEGFLRNLAGDAQ